MQTIIDLVDKVWGKILSLRLMALRLLLGVPFVILVSVIRLILTTINASLYFVALLADFAVDTPKVIITVTKKLIRGQQNV